MNQLYFGDCLDVLKDLRAKYPAGFIDLIYIDPPFNSKRNYNILFEDVNLSDVKAQKEAFADTWSNISYLDTLAEIKEIDLDLFRLLDALNDIKISKSAISYLTTMAIRIWYMHKVLKETGSFYLHCDPNMSHYLKIVCDLIFGEKNFRNEITWKRTSAHSDAKRFGANSDIILFYAKSGIYTFNNVYQPYDADYIARFKNKDPDGRKWADYDLSAKGLTGGGYKYEYKGTSSLWRCPIETMKRFDKEGRLHFTKNGGIRLKRYLEELPGMPCQSVWGDIPPINSQAQERLGYPTQKPLALLERIIKASSNEGDLIADFFCGCGTTVAVSQRLNRQWLGVDISHLAIGLIKKRLKDTYKEKFKEILSNINVDGFPRDIASARELAHTERGRIKFQDWVVEVLIGGVSNPKKSGEGGEDGHFTFNIANNKTSVGIVEVKSGNVPISHLRSFITSVNQKKADMGVFVCFQDKITSGMKREAKAEGTLPNFLKVDKIQILSIEDLMNGKEVQLPALSTFKHFKSATKFTDNSIFENGELFN